MVIGDSVVGAILIIALLSMGAGWAILELTMTDTWKHWKQKQLCKRCRYSYNKKAAISHAPCFRFLNSNNTRCPFYSNRRK